MKDAKVLLWMIFAMYIIAGIASLANAQDPVIVCDPSEDVQVMYANDNQFGQVGTRRFVADISGVHESALGKLQFDLDLSTLPGTRWFTRVEMRYRVRLEYQSQSFISEWSEVCLFWLARVWTPLGAIGLAIPES
jgi:hypothetical protein